MNNLNMRKNYILISLLCLLHCLLCSCQRENEQMEFDTGIGGLYLNLPALERETDIPVITKGSFGMDANDFPVIIYKANDNGGENYSEYNRFDTYSDLVESGFPLLLPQGSYRIKICSYDSEKSVSDIPYFEGIKNFIIQEKTVTNVSVVCSFESIGVELKLSDRLDELLKQHPANYSYKVTVSNGTTSRLFDADNIKPAYFKAACDYLTVKVSITLDGYPYPDRIYRLTNNEVSPKLGEYYLITLDAGTEELKLDTRKINSYEI